MMDGQNEQIRSEIKRLELLKSRILSLHSFGKRVRLLEAEDVVLRFWEEKRELFRFVKALPEKEYYLLLQVVALKQGRFLFAGDEWKHLWATRGTVFVKLLEELELFYKELGGVLGYHLELLYLLCGQEKEDATISYHCPQGFDLTEESEEVREAVHRGILSLPDMGEIYPIGGAGDRLGLRCEKSGEHLPAAALRFCGRTLLEGLIRDLQARENLHYQLFGRQCITPIALMISKEKRNDQYIEQLCERQNWFGRPKESFFLFTQPSVPMITEEGNWVVQDTLLPFLKPGGHGALWKLMETQGVLDWFTSQGRKKALVRQINNPVAGCDYGLLAFCGKGVQEDKAFGFASCSRLIGASEGMNVLVEKKRKGGYSYAIANVEYTEFQKRKIQEQPKEKGSRYSSFPSNTNLLFADLATVKEEAGRCPLPGLLLNMKSSASLIDAQGRLRSHQLGRLESTMQNLSDGIEDSFSERQNLDAMPPMRTYLTYGSREKTISVAKKAYKEGNSFLETPWGALFDLLKNRFALLTERCNFGVPDMGSTEDFVSKGPSFLFLFHPAMGPLWSLIGEKIQGGTLAYGAELLLEIVDIVVRGLELQGSLLVLSKEPLGKINERGEIRYGKERGRCFLQNVTVVNEGIDRSHEETAWVEHRVKRREAVTILLEGNSEFRAENVTLRGKQTFTVPDGHCLSIFEDEEGELQQQLTTAAL